MKKNEKNKKDGEIAAEKPTAAEEPTKEKEIEVSDAKKKFAALIKVYKLQNPVKYEHKKEALAKQLAAMK